MANATSNPTSIQTITFASQVCKAGSVDAMLTYVSRNEASFAPVNHEQLGPGVLVKWKDTTHSALFVPITNIRCIDYAIEPKS